MNQLKYNNFYDILNSLKTANNRFELFLNNSWFILFKIYNNHKDLHPTKITVQKVIDNKEVVVKNVYNNNIVFGFSTRLLLLLTSNV